MSDVKVTIDGKQVEVPKGSTVLQAAQKVGVIFQHYAILIYMI